MTYEEAIKHIGLNANKFWTTVEDLAALQKAIEALDKQIPKKPKRVDHWTLCPTCYDKYGFSYDILVGMRGLKTGECHCLNCGQSIDWSDAE